jgi:hypothetical protein
MVSRLVCLCVLTLVTPVSGFAQNDVKTSVSAGYDFRALDGSGSTSLPVGWSGEIALNVTSFLSTFGQLTGHYKSLGGSARASLYTLGGGLRLSLPSQKAAPFAQILLGTALLRSSSIAQLAPNHIGPVPFGLSRSRGSALAQVGVGVELLRDAPIGLRVGGDYVLAGDEIGNMRRLGVEIVVPLKR